MKASRVTQCFRDGGDPPGVTGGVPSGDTISRISITPGLIDPENNFGEQILARCRLNVPAVKTLVRYGPHPGGVSCSLLKNLSFPPDGPIAFYLPSPAQETATIPTKFANSIRAVSATVVPAPAPAILRGQAHPKLSHAKTPARPTSRKVRKSLLNPVQIPSSVLSRTSRMPSPSSSRAHSRWPGSCVVVAWPRPGSAGRP